MIFRIIKLFLRNISDKWRLQFIVIGLMESALVRPGQKVVVSLNFEKDGTHSFSVNHVEWSCVKKDRALKMLRAGYTSGEVANAYGVDVSELEAQLADERRPKSDEPPEDGSDTFGTHTKEDF